MRSALVWNEHIVYSLSGSCPKLYMDPTAQVAESKLGVLRPERAAPKEIAEGAWWRRVTTGHSRSN